MAHHQELCNRTASNCRCRKPNTPFTLHVSRFTITSDGEKAIRYPCARAQRQMVVSSLKPWARRCRRSDCRKNSPLDRQRSAPADIVPIHLHHRGRIPKVADQRTGRRRGRHVPAVSRRDSHPRVLQRRGQFTQPGGMRNRVGIQQGHDLVRRSSMLRHGLQNPRKLAGARGKPLGQRQHVDIVLSGLLSQLVDHRPRRIAACYRPRSTRRSRGNPARTSPSGRPARRGRVRARRGSRPPGDIRCPPVPAGGTDRGIGHSATSRAAWPRIRPATIHARM